MKLCAWLGLAAMCVSCVASQASAKAKTITAASQTQEDSSYFHYSYFNGNSYLFTWRSEDLRRTPDWPEEKEFPPLSPRKALTAAWADLLSFIPDAKRWELMSITLTRGEGLKWIYRIKFYPPLAYAKPPDPEPKGDLEIIVLMDGTALSPDIRPDRLPNVAPTGPNNEKYAPTKAEHNAV